MVLLNARKAIFRKIPAFLLLGIFVLMVIGQYGLFTLAKLKLHSEVERRIESGRYESFLEKIVMNHHNSGAMKWTRAGKEFVLDGKWYDVVSETTSEGLRAYFCISDEKETSLVKRIEASLAANSSPSAPQHLHHLVKLMLSLTYLLPFQNAPDLQQTTPRLFCSLSRFSGRQTSGSIFRPPCI